VTADSHRPVHLALLGRALSAKHARRSTRAHRAEENFPTKLFLPFGHLIRTRQMSRACTGDKAVPPSPIQKVCSTRRGFDKRIKIVSRARRRGESAVVVCHQR
jgi:hypothetical protein